MPAFPNGRCYCGCGSELEERTAFWARGHDQAAIHRVIHDRYGNVADFVVAHLYGDGLREGVTRLEQLVFPRGRENGPGLDEPRSDAAWEELRGLSAAVATRLDAAECPGASAVLYLAQALLKAHHDDAGEPRSSSERTARAEWGPFQRRSRAMEPQAGDDAAEPQ